jgi:lysophospholipase L1-like esterase
MIRAAATVALFALLLIAASWASEMGFWAEMNLKFPALSSYGTAAAPPPVAVPTHALIEDGQDTLSDGVVLAIADVETDTLSRNVVHFAEALDPFFDALHAGHGEVRIAHYGDSQIEGDRITEHLRNGLRRYMGGGAPGFVPMDDLATNSSYTRKTDGNWKKHSVFQPKDSTRFFGVSGVSYRFEPSHAASVSLDFVRPFYDRVQLLRGPTAQACTLVVASDDTTIAVRILKPTTGFVVDPLPVPPSLKKLKLTFSGAASPELYGLTFDACSGVRVDNFGLRGHSGMGFFKMPTDYLGEQLRKLGYRLIILQFGGNVVPYDVKDFRWYENEFYRLIMRFKRAAPEAAILVVGVSDAARKTDELWRSYPSVPQIRQAQKTAAERAGVAFWDLYEVMGGENSIVAWVNHRPPLAANDHAHFSPYGQRIVGRLLVSALMKAYHDYAVRRGYETDRAPVFQYLPPTYLPPTSDSIVGDSISRDTLVELRFSP